MHRAIVLTAALLFAAGCSSYDPGEALGDLIIVTNTSGPADPDGYNITVEGEPGRALASNDTTRFNGLPIGDYTLTLAGVEPGCTVTDGAVRSVYIPIGVKTIDFFIVCP